VRTLCALFLTMLVIVLPPIMLLYFSIWLLGAAGSRIQINCGNVGRTILIAITAGISVYFRLAGLTDDVSASAFLPDLILSALFAAVLCSLHRSAAPGTPAVLRIAATGRYFAEFSFTLYVIHVPLIHLLQTAMRDIFGLQTLSPNQPLHLAAYLCMLCAIVFSAWLFYLLFESRTPLVRKWAKRKLLRPAPQVQVSA
jgi:peptidoglycan/LPS O-acetylase OafA/YrhL